MRTQTIFVCSEKSKKPVGAKLLICLLIAALFLPPFAPIVNAATFPSDYNQRDMFYKPPTNVSADTLIQYYREFVLSRGDEKYRDTLKAKGITSPFLQYVRFEAIEDPGSCTAQPGHNQVADQPGDFCNISTNHPTWFLLDTNGKRMYNGDMVMMDPGNSEWRSFFLGRVKATQQNYAWDGLMLDNVEGSLVKRKQYNQLPAKYPTDTDYQNAINGMLQYLYAWFKSAGRPMFANLISLKPVSIYFTYLQNLDGAETECWAVNWSGWRSTTDWLENLSRAEQTQSKGKRAILVSQGSQTDTARQQFAYASFLLIDNAKAFFRYALAVKYREAWTYTNYKTAIGIPLGARYQSGTQWCRDYSKGKVCVDPGAHTSSITTF